MIIVNINLPFYGSEFVLVNCIGKGHVDLVVF